MGMEIFLAYWEFLTALLLLAIGFMWGRNRATSQANKGLQDLQDTFRSIDYQAAEKRRKENDQW